MRVIAGTARGVRLIAPKGLDVRPTLDRVRESLFNILAPRLEDARFLDLFAGTGANGIEALSRGARTAVFVDSEPRSLEVIRRNLEAARLAAAATCFRVVLPGALDDLGRKEQPFDVVFADPPYVFADYDRLLAGVGETGLMAQDGIAVIEHAARMIIPENAGGLVRYRQAVYGDTALSFFS
jgi:16S rRNA (guanine(966)-N(2))-methyltransferase RsmD